MAAEEVVAFSHWIKSMEGLACVGEALQYVRETYPGIDEQEALKTALRQTFYLFKECVWKKTPS